jgi:NAD(P)-dependent dehydrogenase (short-subunit alcohol dehydrogenase family)
MGVACDVTDAAQVGVMIDRVVTTCGKLDAAFNNAGVNSESATFLETSDDEFERVMTVNLRGVWNCMKGEVRQMLAQGSGAIGRDAKVWIGFCLRPPPGRSVGSSHQRVTRR